MPKTVGEQWLPAQQMLKMKATFGLLKYSHFSFSEIQVHLFFFYLKQAFMLGLLSCPKPATSGLSFPYDLGEICF